MHSNDAKSHFSLTPRTTLALTISICLFSIPATRVLGDALRDALLPGRNSTEPSQAPHVPPSRSSPVQLDVSSFELAATSYDFETNTYTSLQERYSSQQKRGRVRLTTRRLDARSQSGQTQVYLVDTELNSSVRRNELTNECQPTEWGSVLAHLNFDLIEFESNVSGHLFGAARLLRYFTVHRSQLRADISDKRYFIRNKSKSVRYTKRFVRERPTSDAGESSGSGPAEPLVLEVSVFYTEASLAGAADWTHALPVRIQGEYPHEQRKGFVLDFGPIKFLDGDDVGGLAGGHEPGVLMDGLAMEPASGCSQAITKRFATPWAELQGAKWRTNSFSFWAKGRHLTANFVSHRASHFQARVAYDARLNKLRVDMQSDSLGETIQITDFVLDKTTHILPRPGTSSFLADFLREPESGLKQDGNLTSGQVRHELPVASAGGSEPLFKCVNGEVNSTPQTKPSMSLDNLLMGGAENYAYLGLARVRGVRARVFEATNTQLPFWLDPQIHAAASADRFRSPAQQRQIITVIYLSEPAHEESQVRLLLMEIYEMDKELKSTFNKREISVFDFGWNLQAIGSSELAGARQAVSLFSLLELCSEWLPGSGQDQEDNESHAHFRMIIRSDKQLTGNEVAHLEYQQNDLQLGLLSSIQLDMDLVLGLIYDFEVRHVRANGPVARGDKENLSLLVEFNVGRIPERLHKMMFLGRGRRVANKSWFIRVVSLQECFMLASHRQQEVEFAYDATNSFCYIATTARRSRNPNSQTDEAPFQMDSRAAMNVFKTLKVTDYHKLTREWWLSEPELSSRRRRGLFLDLAGRVERLKMHIDHIRVSEHNAHLLYDSSSLVDRAGVLLGLGLNHQEELNRLGHVEPHHGQKSSEQRLTLGQCQSLCDADFSCRSYSFCLRGLEVECVLSKANLNEPEILSEIRLFVLDKTASSRRFELGSDGHSVTMKKKRNCATYNKQYLNYYTKSSDVSLEQVFYQRVLPAAELEQCAELCFKQLLGSRHHKAVDKFGHQSTPDYDIFAQRTEGAELLDDDDAEGCSRFYFVDVACQDQKEVRDNFELPADSHITSGLCLLTATISSPGLKLRSAKLDPDKVASYGMKFSRLYDEEYQISLRRPKLDETEGTAIQNVIDAGLQRQAPDGESLKVVKRVLDRNENLQMVTFVDKEVCARFCYTQSAGLWPYCSSFDVIVSHHAYAGPRTRCVLNSSTKRRLLAGGREDLIDSSHWTGPNSSDERWHYEIKDGFVAHRRRHWLKSEDAELDGERHDQVSFMQSEFFHSIKIALSVYLAIALGVFLGIILVELLGDTMGQRRNSVASEMELINT